MSIYAQIGSSSQQVGGDCPNGWIVMVSERPSPEHVAKADGAWEVPVPAPKTVFSSLEYLSKFTDAEYTAVRSGSMALQRGLDSLIAAQFVDLNDPRTAMYLSGMVAAGIIDEARKAELLTPQAA